MLASSHVEIDGARVHLVSGGQGRTVLFLHGVPEFWFAWKAQLGELSKTHRVIAIDLPGCNLSSPLPSPDDYAIERVADRIAKLIRTLAPGERVALVGHDVGGVLAWEIAARHEASVSRLVAINAPPSAILARELAREPAQRRASEYMRLFARPGAEAALAARGFERLAANVFDTARTPDAFSAADRRAYLASWSRPGALSGALAYYRAHAPQPARDRADDREAPTRSRGGVRVPTLVLWGMDDPFLLPGCLDGIEASGTDVRVHRVPGATHWIVREESALVNAELRAFLDDAPAHEHAHDDAPARDHARDHAREDAPLDFTRPRFDLVAHREIWRRHPDYGCFLSSPDNPRGLRLTPKVDPGRVWLHWRVEREHSGIIGIAHGGVAFTILDGMMGWLIMSHLGRAGVTTSARIRYSAPLRVGEKYEFEATPAPGETHTERRVAVRARAFPVGRPTDTRVELEADFTLLDREAAEALLERALDPSELPFFPSARKGPRSTAASPAHERGVIDDTTHA